MRQLIVYCPVARSATAEAMSPPFGHDDVFNALAIYALRRLHHHHHYYYAYGRIKLCAYMRKLHDAKVTI